MGALLRYILYQIAFSLILFEIALMVFFGVAIIVIKIITKRNHRRRKMIQQEITGIIEKEILSSAPVEDIILPSNAQRFRDIVETLEEFDNRFNDERWIAIKDKIVERYLKPYEERHAKSFSWFNRQLAARSLLLCPEKADEKLLSLLLHDKRYLVRVAAASCVIKISNQKLFNEVIKTMSKETALSRFPYRDALLHADQQKFDWIEDILKTETDHEIIAICLDILSTRYSNDLLKVVQPFLKDSNQDCRILAVRALGKIPNEESRNLLITGLQDSDWEIRAESIIGLQNICATQAIPKIADLLNDPVWWVRLKAAIALKEFGEDGINFLKQQNSQNEPLAYEISQYILALP